MLLSTHDHITFKTIATALVHKWQWLSLYKEGVYELISLREMESFEVLSLQQLMHVYTHHDCLHFSLWNTEHQRQFITLDSVVFQLREVT